MSFLTKRVQVLFPQEMWEELEEQAHRQKESIGSLIRKAVEQTYFDNTKEKGNIQRREIVAQMAAMNLPVDDWQVMEMESTGYEPLL